MKSEYFLILFVLVLFISGCAQNVPNLDDSGITPEIASSVVEANNLFAMDLYSKYSEQKDGNIFFSPYSISTALAMTYEGARGETADEIRNVFHYPDKETLRVGNAGVYNEINAPNQEYRLSVANALWAEQTYPFLSEYLQIVSDYYGGGVKNMNFKGNPDGSRIEINKWVEDKTNGKIKDLIPAGVITDMTRLVLTNAIYFKGNWLWEFDKSKTRELDFRINSANIVKTEMMYMDPDKARFSYANLEKLQILELPYKGDKISMLILLPKQGKEYDFETGEEIIYDYSLEDVNLSYEDLENYKSKMAEEKLDAIYLPKFEFDTKYFMSKDLKEMGMSTAFSLDADFSGIDGNGDLFITDVIHQAFVKVDEEGTEAVAATAVVMGETASRQVFTKTFRADHPFIFIIQQKDTGNILFMGRVVNPNE